MTSGSCQTLIEKAIEQGTQTHVANQVGGIYVLRKKSTTLATMSKFYSATSASQLDGLYKGYTRHGLS